MPFLEKGRKLTLLDKPQSISQTHCYPIIKQYNKTLKRELAGVIKNYEERLQYFLEKG